MCSVEAAGGLQLFVDSNMSVDSVLIRQLVDEVLTEHVALILGHRDAPDTGPEPGLEAPKPDPGAPQEVQQLRGKYSFKMFSLSECAAASVPGETGATGSYTSTHPSSQPDPAQQTNHSSDHTPTL